MKREMLMVVLVAISFGTMMLFSNGQQVSASEKKKLLRIGVYDSRGIAIAYCHSRFSGERYEKLKARSDAAEAAGDEQTVEAIKEMGRAQQAKQHLQGFGTAPVHEYLEYVRDHIPDVAKAAGVDVIVSKWEFDYMASDADVVDVTMELAKLFEPKEKAYKWIEQMKDKDPIPAEELKRLEKEHPH
ncbi:MAG: hypothetical protein ACYSUG_03275 [Planctomycetota bacterium]|jgi:hypothetical protein